MQCSVMGCEALEAAIQNYKTGETVVRDLPDEHDHVVCTCFGVTESEIARVVRENSLSTVEQVTHYCKAGGACGKCWGEIEKIIENGELRVENAEDKLQTAKPPMTNLQKIKLIQEVIDRDVRPHLQRDGGDLELVDVDGDKVVIAFRGLCAKCPSSALTRVNLVQAKLREHVLPTLTVVEEP